MIQKKFVLPEPTVCVRCRIGVLPLDADGLRKHNQLCDSCRERLGL